MKDMLIKNYSQITSCNGSKHKRTLNITTKNFKSKRAQIFITLLKKTGKAFFEFLITYRFVSLRFNHLSQRKNIIANMQILKVPQEALKITAECKRMTEQALQPLTHIFGFVKINQNFTYYCVALISSE